MCPFLPSPSGEGRRKIGAKIPTQGRRGAKAQGGDWKPLERKGCRKLGAPTSGRFEREAEADGFGDGHQRGEAGIAFGREGAVEAFAFDAGFLGDFGDAATILADLAQDDEENARFVVFERGAENLGGEGRIGAEFFDESVFVGDGSAGDGVD